ncbi:MAG: hypothetical protein AB7H81_09655 [Vicinamibacterales bacterium]
MVTVHLGRVEPARLVATLEAHGFSPRLPVTDAFVNQTRAECRPPGNKP